MISSNPTRVKICGLTRPEDVQAAIRYGADYLGFIVEAKSKRKLSVSEAARLAGPAAGIIPRVAVTVNADDTLLTQIMSEMAPDYIQCHGDESVDRVAEIPRRYKVKVIKAVTVSTPADMKTAEQYSGACDFVLYDAKPPKGADVRGGHGLAFDWSILTQAPLPKLWALAGGLTPETARQAISQTKAPILDVSSGVEASAGLKDALKIQAFMDALHNG